MRRLPTCLPACLPACLRVRCVRSNVIDHSLSTLFENAVPCSTRTSVQQGLDTVMRSSNNPCGTVAGPTPAAASPGHSSRARITSSPSPAAGDALAHVHSVSSTTCVDEDLVRQQCKALAARGECSANREFMSKSCRESCGLCHGTEYEQALAAALQAKVKEGARIAVADTAALKAKVATADSVVKTDTGELQAMALARAKEAARLAAVGKVAAKEQAVAQKDAAELTLE
jgi:hypothetical protein